MAATDRSGKIRLWNLNGGTLQRIIDGHEVAIWSLIFGSDGRRLISTSDAQVCMWDVPKGVLRATLTHAGGANTRAIKSPDGKLLAVTTADGKVKLWDGLSVDRACEIGAHAFDSVRQHQYLGQNERSLACD